MAKTVMVRTAPGRVALTAPRGGKVIPSNHYVSVIDSHWIRQRIAVGDLIEEPGPVTPEPGVPPALQVQQPETPQT